MLKDANASFAFGSLDLDVVINLLKANLTVNNCLTNCTLHGSCMFLNGNSLLCSCFEHFTGEKCSVDSRGCSSNPCLNNATCVNNLTNYSFKCDCDKYYEVLRFYLNNKKGK